MNTEAYESYLERIAPNMNKRVRRHLYVENGCTKPSEWFELLLAVMDQCDMPRHVQQQVEDLLSMAWPEDPAPERDEPVVYNRGELPPRDNRDEHNRTL